MEKSDNVLPQIQKRQIQMTFPVISAPFRQLSSERSALVAHSRGPSPSVLTQMQRRSPAVSPFGNL